MAAIFKFGAFFLLLLLGATWCQAVEEDSGGHTSSVITIGALLPYTKYAAVNFAFNESFHLTMNRFKERQNPVFNFTRVYPNIRLKIVMLPPKASPDDILKALCFEFLSENVSAIVHVANHKTQKSIFSSAEYFLQMTNYLTIPVLSTWNPASEGYNTTFQKSVVLKFAPNLCHQAAAMLSVLQRYEWEKFSFVTSRVFGHDIIRLCIDWEILNPTDDHKFEMVRFVSLNNTDDPNTIMEQLRVLADGEARIILLHCTEMEAVYIMDAARELNLTRKEFVWIVTKAAIDRDKRVSQALPVGMLGIDFDDTFRGQLAMFRKAILVLGHGLESFVNDPNGVNLSLNSNLSCYGRKENIYWENGKHLYRHLIGVQIFEHKEQNQPDPVISFDSYGSLNYIGLNLMNLDANHQWTKVGTWEMDTLSIKDIVWPGESPYPPYGKPEDYHLKVSFLEEPPYVHMDWPDNKTGRCHDHSVRCLIPPVPAGIVDPTGVGTNETQSRCCSGFCVDLLRHLARDMAFTFEMRRVADGLWGGIQPDGTWNGIMAELIEKKVDIAMTALKINSNRQRVVEFSVPFLETGISVVVAKRTGIISPKAFLEPFDVISWFFIFGISLQAAAVSIFVFEWLSPSGYDKKLTPTRGHNFSLFRTYWLVWALLLGASVNVSVPRGYTARFMSNVWAGFTKVFLAIYTANLAAFMITREEFFNLNGLEDPRLLFPASYEPALRFGTIPSGNTDDILKANFPVMHHYMKNHSRPTVREGIIAVKKRELDAFIYDSTVLEYLVGQDDECRLLTVGSWYAMTGYGVAFPQKSSLLQEIDEHLLWYGSNGVLSRLTDFWMGGACKINKNNDAHLTRSFVPIGLKQFTSAFILLGIGLALGFVLVGLESLYFTYLRAPLARRQRTNNFCNLISLNLGHSLTFEDVVSEARDIYKSHKCKDPICDTILWKVRHQLDLSKLKILQLNSEIKKLKEELQDMKEQKYDIAFIDDDSSNEAE